MDEVGIPSVPSNDRRTKPKDERHQSHQRAVMLSNAASRKRRKDYIERQESVGAIPTQPNINETSDQTETTNKKRKRAPNRPKEVIEEEKRQKQARKLAKSDKSGL
jgi:hypothetical protein